MRVTCPAHLILLDMITLTVCDEGYKSTSNGARHSPTISSLLRPNIFLQPPVTSQCTITSNVLFSLYLLTY
jgi:hypothetical protein